MTSLYGDNAIIEKEDKKSMNIGAISLYPNQKNII